MNMENKDIIPVEQQRYATLLSWGARSGLAILAVTFLAYVFGMIPAHVPLDQLPNYWSMPTAEYLAATNSPTGWNWLGKIAEGDYAGLLGIAWLSGCSLICLVAVMPIYAKRGEKIFVGLCIAALAVQLLAASGILHSGH